MIGLSDQPSRKRSTPITAATPTPAPTASTSWNDQPFSSSHRYGDCEQSTSVPTACRAPIAGSAKVTPTPSTPAPSAR